MRYNWKVEPKDISGIISETQSQLNINVKLSQNIMERFGHIYYDATAPLMLNIITFCLHYNITDKRKKCWGAVS